MGIEMEMEMEMVASGVEDPLRPVCPMTRDDD
jgi:hypothetical protein